MFSNTWRNEAKDNNSIGQPTTELLAIEYKALVSSGTYTRVAHRFLLAALIMFQLAGISATNWSTWAVSVVGVVVAIWWRLHEISMARRIRDIGEIVAQLDSNDEVVEAFIKYRHGLWEQSQNLRLQMIEPVVWLLVLVAISVGLTLFA